MTALFFRIEDKMKLKYYLRGLAVGIIVTTVILSIVHADKHPLTDAEIRMRALELGMVDEDSIRLTDQSGGMSAAGEGDESDAEPNKAAESETDDGSDNPTADEEASKDGSTPEESVSEESTPEESASVPETSTEPEESETEAVTIVIRSGDNSYTVSRDLAAAGLVEDAAAYDAFLCNNGYSKTIRTGTYEILPGTSGEDIAKMIAR